MGGSIRSGMAVPRRVVAAAMDPIAFLGWPALLPPPTFGVACAWPQASRRETGFYFSLSFDLCHLPLLLPSPLGPPLPRSQGGAAVGGSGQGGKGKRDIPRCQPASTCFLRQALWRCRVAFDVQSTAAGSPLDEMHPAMARHQVRCAPPPKRDAYVEPWMLFQPSDILVEPSLFFSFFSGERRDRLSPWASLGGRLRWWWSWWWWW